MKKDKIYFSNLDAIRFIAALIVYLQHGFKPSYQLMNIKGSFIERVLNTISFGGTGVSIFFVLSGFLITYLLLEEHNNTGYISINKFYMRRVLRIWPLYFAVVLFAFVIYPVIKSFVWVNNPLCSEPLFYFTFLSNFDVIRTMKNCFGNDAMSQVITWSVAIEEQFYLIWPLVFAFIPKRGWLISILLFITTSIAFRLYHYNDGTVLYFHSLSVLLDLSIGGLFAYLSINSKIFRQKLENAGTKNHILLFTTTAIILLFPDYFFSFKYGEAIGRICSVTLFAFIISSQALTQSKSILNLGNWKFGDKWGKYTYGIYLLHPIAITLIDVVVRLLHLDKNNLYISLSIGFIGLITTLILSKTSYIYFESFFLKIKNKYAKA